VSGSYPKHFDGECFFNPDAPQARGLRDVLRWQLNNHKEPSPDFVADVQPSVPPPRVDGATLRVTLINHSTVLLQQNGSNILTDPIWSQRASPVAFAGPKRRREPGVRFEDLPAIDTVLLSHSHYDHLDLPTLRRLRASVFIAPLGVARLLKANGIGPVQEMDWGESRAVQGATIHSVPALHFSARGLSDRNRTLWCGYMIESPGGLVYFAGDTAFGNHFAQIRERFEPPRLALLPIGAYEPRWFMGAVHMPPEDAIRAHGIIGARTSIGIHWGTFQLADEGLDTPKRVLAASGQPDSFLTPGNGEALDLAW
jgi:L-ascorbate metabolism protein UlaG (beta-lactamase superfamily)